MKVVIMRGAPGFGKSTYRKKHYPDAVIASADLYFTGADGVYRFDMARIGKAHDFCWNVFEGALHRGEPLIVVDNTNVKVRDFKRYVEAAKAAGYEVEIVRLACDIAKAAARGVHNVPSAVVERMAKALEESKLPEGWTETVVRTDESENPPACN